MAHGAWPTRPFPWSWGLLVVCFVKLAVLLDVLEDFFFVVLFDVDTDGALVLVRRVLLGHDLRVLVAFRQDNSLDRFAQLINGSVISAGQLACHAVSPRFAPEEGGTVVEDVEVVHVKTFLLDDLELHVFVVHVGPYGMTGLAYRYYLRYSVLRASVPSARRRPGRLTVRPGASFEVTAVSYWEIRDALHQLMVRTTAFHEQVMSDDPDWQDLWQVHLELCRIERFLELKENE